MTERWVKVTRLDLHTPSVVESRHEMWINMAMVSSLQWMADGDARRTSVQFVRGEIYVAEHPDQLRGLDGLEKEIAFDNFMSRNYPGRKIPVYGEHPAKPDDAE